jgi:hypothetical protein
LQVGGFLQRIDYVRKHAFAVLSILKDDQGQFPIRCAAEGGCKGGRGVAYTPVRDVRHLLSIERSEQLEVTEYNQCHPS